MKIGRFFGFSNPKMAIKKIVQKLTIFRAGSKKCGGWVGGKPEFCTWFEGPQSTYKTVSNGNNFLEVSRAQPREAAKKGKKKEEVNLLRARGPPTSARARPSGAQKTSIL